MTTKDDEKAPWSEKADAPSSQDEASDSSEEAKDDTREEPPEETRADPPEAALVDDTASTSSPGAEKRGDPLASASSSVPREGWHVPRPEVIPRSTAWPAAMALGITFFAWGLVTSLIMLFAGLLVFVVSLAGWIGEIRHERRQEA